jgi:mRNA deadenylase 3'-5' endonuclease subunit Ccr4
MRNVTEVEQVSKKTKHPVAKAYV